MTNTKQYARNPDFIFRNVAGEAVLIPLMKDVADLEAIYTLNEVGVFIWENMEYPTSMEEVAQQISAEFEVEESVLKADLTQFFGELMEAGIIKEVK